MTTQTILDLISLINRKAHQDKIFLNSIGGNVYLARIWFDENEKTRTADYPSLSGWSAYFVKNERGVVVAAVLDMGPSELHWVVDPAYQRKGYLSSALIDYIMPHLVHVKNRYDQMVSFDSAETLAFKEASLKVAIKAGFELVNGVGRINQKSIKKPPIVELPDDQSVDQKRITALDLKVKYAVDLLESVADELELRYGTSELLRSIVQQRFEIECQPHDVAYPQKG